MENIDAKNAETGNINSLGKKFRINSKSFFLTYPKCTLKKDEIFDLLPEKHNIIQYYIAEEKHKDGTPHLHVLIKYNYKRNICNQNHFDIGGFHGNYMGCKKWRNAVAYVCKDNNFNSYVTLDSSDPDGFVKRKKDFDAWKAYKETEERKEITYPVEFLGIKIDKPDPNIKKRHYWIVAPADWGKTQAIENGFEDMRVYKRSNNEFPFETYDNEDIIIYDDIEKINFEEISAVSNTYKTITQVFGKVRYTTKNWKKNHTRTMIVLSNYKPMYKNQEAVEARFNVIDLTLPPKLIRS